MFTGSLDDFWPENHFKLVYWVISLSQMWNVMTKKPSSSSSSSSSSFSVSAYTPIILQIWPLHNTGLHSRSTPSCRSPCDEMDMTIWVQGGQGLPGCDCGWKQPVFNIFPTGTLSLRNVIWSDTTTAVLYLNILVPCSYPSVIPVPPQIISGVLHKTFVSYGAYLFPLI